MSKFVWPTRNFNIYGVCHGQPTTAPTHFRGTLPEVKTKVQEILKGLGLGWSVMAESDGEVIYCAYDHGRTAVEQPIDAPVKSV